MGLVKGFTDILTPVNLIPNSNFSRGGGLPRSGTIESLAVNASYQIAEGIYLQSANSINSNISYNFDNQGLTITATESASNGRLWLVVNAAQEKGKIYSLYAEFTFINNVGISLPNTAGGHTDLYGSVTEHNAVRVVNMTNTNNSNYVLQLGPNYTEGSTFTILIKGLALYEGAFCNPPFTDSLDVKVNNQFMLGQNSQVFYYLNQGVPSQSYVFNNYTNGSNTYEIESLRYVQRTSITGAQHTHFKCKCYLTTIFGNASGAFHNRNKLFTWDCYFSVDGTGNIVQNCDLTSTSQLSYISNPTLSMSGLDPSGGILKFTLSFTHANYIYANNHYIFTIMPELMLPAENYEFIFPKTPISAKKLNN